MFFARICDLLMSHAAQYIHWSELDGSAVPDCADGVFQLHADPESNEPLGHMFQALLRLKGLADRSHVLPIADDFDENKKPRDFSIGAPKAESTQIPAAEAVRRATNIQKYLAFAARELSSSDELSRILMNETADFGSTETPLRAEMLMEVYEALIEVVWVACDAPSSSQQMNCLIDLFKRYVDIEKALIEANVNLNKVHRRHELRQRPNAAQTHHNPSNTTVLTAGAPAATQAIEKNDKGVGFNNKRTRNVVLLQLRTLQDMWQKIFCDREAPHEAALQQLRQCDEFIQWLAERTKTKFAVFLSDPQIEGVKAVDHMLHIAGTMLKVFALDADQARNRLATQWVECKEHYEGVSDEEATTGDQCYRLLCMATELYAAVVDVHSQLFFDKFREDFCLLWADNVLMTAGDGGPSFERLVSIMANAFTKIVLECVEDVNKRIPLAKKGDKKKSQATSIAMDRAYATVQAMSAAVRHLPRADPEFQIVLKLVHKMVQEFDIANRRLCVLLWELLLHMQLVLPVDAKPDAAGGDQRQRNNSGSSGAGMSGAGWCVLAANSLYAEIGPPTHCDTLGLEYQQQFGQQQSDDYKCIKGKKANATAVLLLLCDHIGKWIKASISALEHLDTVKSDPNASRALSRRCCATLHPLAQSMIRLVMCKSEDMSTGDAERLHTQIVRLIVLCVRACRKVVRYHTAVCKRGQKHVLPQGAKELLKTVNAGVLPLFDEMQQESGAEPTVKKARKKADKKVPLGGTARQRALLNLSSERAGYESDMHLLSISMGVKVTQLMQSLSANLDYRIDVDAAVRKINEKGQQRMDASEANSQNESTPVIAPAASAGRADYKSAGRADSKSAGQVDVATAGEADSAAAGVGDSASENRLAEMEVDNQKEPPTENASSGSQPLFPDRAMDKFTRMFEHASQNVRSTSGSDSASTTQKTETSHA